MLDETAQDRNLHLAGGHVMASFGFSHAHFIMYLDVKAIKTGRTSSRWQACPELALQTQHIWRDTHLVKVLTEPAPTLDLFVQKVPSAR